MDNGISKETIDRSSVKAAVKQIANHFRERIRNGDLPPGSLLPSLHELSQGLDVNKHTVRDAMDFLRKERLIKSRPGLGTFASTEPKWKRVTILFFHALFIRMKDMARKVVQSFSIKAKQKKTLRKR